MRFGVRFAILAAVVLLVSLYTVHALTSVASVDLVVDGSVTRTIGPGVTCQVPETLRPTNARGIDSQVTQFADPTTIVSFDFGWYSNPLKDDGARPQYSERTVRIGGMRARLVRTRHDGDPDKPFFTAVSFRNVSGSGKMSNHLTGWSQSATPAGQEMAEQIFRTIRFNAGGAR